MDDRNVEEILRRYRPTGPEASLRDRCLRPFQVAGPPRPAYKGQEGRIASGRTWPWLAAAAAVLTAVTVLQVAGERAVAQAGRDVGPDAVEPATAALVAALGGDDDARQLAAVLLAEDQRRGETDAPAFDPRSLDSGGRR